MAHVRSIGLVGLAAAMVAGVGRGADVAEGEKLFRAGKYEECRKLAAEETSGDRTRVEWWVLRMRAEAVLGRYEAAGRTADEARGRYPGSVAIAIAGYEVFRQGGRPKDAEAVVPVIEKLLPTVADRDDAAERVAAGRYLLGRGADAKEVLDKYFAAVTRADPKFVDAHLATAELALAKNDKALAAETLQKAPKEAAADPQFHYLLAVAFADDDRARAEKAAADALALNPHHVDTLLFRADHEVNAEDYAAAGETLKQVLAVDPGEPRAWAYRAVIAHLKSDAAGEAAAREAALTRWAANPEVDHLIGRKLSQDYRFAEGSAYQRKVLAVDPKYLPAKVQLCQDLLRLGEEEEGWKLAAEVFAADGYNVVAFNLVTLKDQLAKYKTIAGDGFLLRMEAKEADLYGPRALALLSRARKTLGEKYGVKFDKAVTVEIFPRKQDFAVRTFGMPGAEGFLGVCFGPVITANSPASQGKDPSNWEAVLWHEYCHTVTLAKTRNKMPRWLSEGISVYEELRENPAWGQWLTPRYREMIKGEDLTPVSKLSSAFLSPKSAHHVQFAYFESAMVVDYLVGKHGLDALKGVLDDLGAGMPINEALARRTGGSVEKLDKDFAEYIRGKADAVAAGATWEKPEWKDEPDEAAVRAWLKEHPKNYPGLQRLAVRLMKDEKWAEAEAVWKEQLTLYPSYIGPDNAYEGLAAVYRQAKDAAKEAAILEEWAERDGDAGEAFQRLIQLGEAAGDWKAVAANARRWLAVNPLLPAPHRALAVAAANIGERAEALAAYRALLHFSPPDTADVHYHLARLHRAGGEIDAAKREVLKALEEAPRSQDALKLLLELTERK